MDFDLLAAQFRGATGGAGVLLDVLAKKFQDALPGLTRVRRELRILGGRIVDVQLDLGTVRYRFESPQPSLVRVTRQRLSRGVAVGALESLSGDVWIEALCRDLQALAETESLNQEALQKLLGVQGGM